MCQTDFSIVISRSNVVRLVLKIELSASYIYCILNNDEICFFFI